MSDSGRHAFGLIGPDKIPVITLPGDPVVAYIAAELFVRPMIRTMLGSTNIYRSVVKAKLTNDLVSKAGERAFVRAKLANENGAIVTVLPDQNDLTTLSDSSGLILVPEDVVEYKAGELVKVLIMERNG
jgi:molybdopterin molybdotransferase